MPIYRIIGAYEETGSAVTLEVEAADEGKAALIAERRRVLVQRIELVGKARAASKPNLWKRAEAALLKLDEPRPKRTQMAPTLRRSVEDGVVNVPAREATIGDVIYIRRG